MTKFTLTFLTFMCMINLNIVRREAPGGGEACVQGKKVYLQPRGMLLDAVHDLVELQRGRKLKTDTPQGTVQFVISMYGFKWELHFTVTDVGKNRCQVRLEISGDPGTGVESIIHREFALLDSMLILGAKIEITDKEPSTDV